MAHQHLVQCLPVRLLEISQFLAQFLIRASVEGKVALLHEDFGVLIHKRLAEVRVVRGVVMNVRGNTTFQRRHL